MDYKEKVIKRQASNKEIMAYLQQVVDACPDLRFNQILANLDLPYCIRDTYEDHEHGGYTEDCVDLYDEESVDTLEKVKVANDKFWKIKLM